MKLRLHNNLEISRVVFMPNITTNHAITYINNNNNNNNNTNKNIESLLTYDQIAFNYHRLKF